MTSAAVERRDPSATAPVLSIRDASLGFGDRHLWSGLDLDVAPGQFVAILGPNGSGKTSLLRAILGTQPLTSGRIEILGEPVRRGHRLVGYVPQQHLADRGTPLRARDFLALGIDGDRFGLPLPSADRRRRVDAMLDTVQARAFDRTRTRYRFRYSHCFNLDGISKRYRGEPAVDDLSFNVQPGCTFGLLGRNGSGKSTTLHVLTGLLRPTAGAVYLHGIPITSKESRRYLGFAPDDLPLLPALTGEEYLQLHRRLRQRTSAREELGLAEALGILDHLDKLISEYSHEMKRKLQLTAALAHQPSLLVLDEPYRGLDPESSALLISMLRIFRDKGGAILVATHDMMRAELSCDEVGIINRGSMIATGSPRDLCEQFQARDLEEVFLRSIGVDQQHADREMALDELLAPSRPVPVDYR